MKRVAIIMPVKSLADPLLEKAVAGVKSQDFKDWSLYVVQDGPEESGHIPHLAAENIHTIRIHKQGPAVARNAALNAIVERGWATHAAYCDSDDIWDPSHLRESLEFMESNGADFVYSDCRYVNERGEPMVSYGMLQVDEFNIHALAESNYIWISSVVHSAKCLLACPAFFDAECVPLEDWNMWLTMASHTSNRFIHRKKTSVTYLVKDSTYYDATDNAVARARIYEKRWMRPDPATKEGWLHKDEGEFLRRVAVGKNCLELGSYKGKSALYMASTAKSVTCVDTFQADGGGQNQTGSFSTLDAFRENTHAYTNKIITVIGKSTDVAEHFPDDFYDLIFIDAMHDYESVKNDADTYWPKLKVGGIMAFHDYQGDWPGVVKFVNETFTKPDKVVENMAVVVKESTAEPAKVVERMVVSKMEFGIVQQEGVTNTVVLKKLLIAPFSHRMSNGKANPKDYPWWAEAINIVKNKVGTRVVQIGVPGEPKILGADRQELGKSFADLSELLDWCDAFASVDSFLPHFANYMKVGKPGVVIFSQSDPNIFGYKANTNLLKGREYLRTGQYFKWDEATYNEDAFVKPDVVAEKIVAALSR